MKGLLLANTRFYEIKPQTIICMQIQDNLLALSRSDASIEIWNLNDACFLERRIANTTENYSIEGIAWCQKNLFTVGLHGFLFKYDVSELRHIHKTSVTGGAAYCLDVNKDTNAIAVGTEYGYLNIFSVTDDDVTFVKFLDKQEGAIVCLKYDPTGKFIVSGSADAIRVWDVSTGHALHRMTTGRSEANKETMVWCLAVLSDLTVISGDSRGKLTFWDGNIGSQIESYQSHEADILSVCISEDENSLFCVGVDPVINHYVRITVKDDKKKWVRSIQRVVHDHDVRALALYGDKLYSGGIDSYLACSYYPPKTILKYPNILPSPCVTLATQAEYMMLQHSDSIEIWSMPYLEDVKTARKESPRLIQPAKPAKRLAVISSQITKIEGKHFKDGVSCCSISDDGKYVAYCRSGKTKLFQFESDGVTTAQLTKIHEFNSLCHQVVFTPDNSQLILVLAEQIVQILTLEGSSIADKQDIDVSKDIEDTIIHAKVSKFGKYLVIADVCSNIVVYSSKNGQWSRYCKLPKYKSVPTALSISQQMNLIVVYADHKLIEYDIKNREFTDFSRTFGKLPSEGLSRSYPIRNVLSDPCNPSAIILHDDSRIVTIHKVKIEKESLQSPEKASKIIKLNPVSDHIKKRTAKFVKLGFPKYKHLVHLEWLHDQELVAVEVPPFTITKDLPPRLVKKKFGEK